MTQPTQEQIMSRKQHLDSPPKHLTYYIAELQLKVEALQSLQKEQGETNEEADITAYRIWAEKQYSLDRMSPYAIFKAGRDSKK